MSPDLERLLNPLWEKRNCEPKDRARWKATAERLIQDALAKYPSLSRDQLMDAITPGMRSFAARAGNATPRFRPGRDT